MKNDFDSSKRTIVVEGYIDQKRTGEIVAQLMYLNHMDATAPICMQIKSANGTMLNGYAIADYMRSVDNRIDTISSGIHTPFSSILYEAGDVRKMASNTYVIDGTNVKPAKPQTGPR